MANYVKNTNFTQKDTLPTGNPLKIVKGSEFDVELNAIATAISSKADANSPELSGVPLAPTAATGANSQQIATTAFVANTASLKVDKTTQVATSGGLQGGGDLSATRTLSIAAGSNGFGTRTVSTIAPSGGVDGDIWYCV